MADKVKQAGKVIDGLGKEPLLVGDKSAAENSKKASQGLAQPMQNQMANSQKT